MTEAVFTEGDSIDEARRLPAITHVQRGKQLLARVTCICCPAKQEQPVSHHMDKPQLRMIFRSLGWGDVNGQMICPNCVRSRRTPPPANTTEVTIMSAPASQPSNDNGTAAGKEVRQPTPQELRQIMSALETWFVDGVYVEGKSDAVIARELDLPKRMVENWRIEAFGHIKNKELDAIKVDAQDLRARLTDLFRRIAGLESNQPK
jgi:hypothetical protein